MILDFVAKAASRLHFCLHKNPGRGVADAWARPLAQGQFGGLVMHFDYIHLGPKARPIFFEPAVQADCCSPMAKIYRSLVVVQPSKNVNRGLDCGGPKVYYCHESLVCNYISDLEKNGRGAAA